MKEYVPYVYIVKNLTTQLKYIGVRYAAGCNPCDLWSSYFTSSGLVKKLIDEFGVDDFYVRVIHKFPKNPEAAIRREARYFQYIKQRDDYLNMTYSSGCQDLRIASKGGKVGGAIAYSKGVGIFRSEEERKEWAISGGTASWKSGNNSQFAYWASEKGRKHRSSLGGKNGGFTAKCIGKLRNVTEADAKKILSEQQSLRGKRGGVKNKGFIWYTDGIKTYKYTAAEQANLSFDLFLAQNAQFRKGRK